MSFIKNRSFLAAFFIGLLTLSGAALAQSPEIIAQVHVSGGFMAPGFANTSIVKVLASGNVVYTSYEIRDFGTPVEKTIPVAVLSKAKTKALKALIAKIQDGPLVDQDPTGPTGADFPNVVMTVFQNGQKHVISRRGGDAHTFVLEQDGVSEITRLLGNLEEIAYFGRN